MNNKLTQWYPAEIKPYRVGTYKTNSRGICFQYWNGKYWGYCCDQKNIAEIYKYNKSCMQNVKWRGLSNKPISK